MVRISILLVAAAVSAAAFAFNRDRNDDRWNRTGPAWYATPCGHQGFSHQHGVPYTEWRKPCSVPVRVCEFEKLTISYPAEPDVPCSSMAKPEAAGELKRTYLKGWD